MKIELSINSPKAFLGLITGTDSQYGFALDFQPIRQISRSYVKAEIIAPGTYKTVPGTQVGTRRNDTGYIGVDEDGNVSELTKEQVGAIFTITNS